ncbi:carbamate kinase [Thermosediminibacter litoriperuensis]|uniref:Carbamate kinase n=1 Tax=Thermosediminibacter litoriperuensis TaxID=291989 RepID=A0A5S5AHH9_9FIRM|nr:carbamate kinase [Thermosediminibacter litoriperuensis]TYP48669.1 carbamate kinase [Thermosediminibacter litoriperuensis]
MNGKKVVIALGGNAILQPGQKGTFESQLENIKITAKQLVSLVERGYQLLITHGNGPQVGQILLQQKAAEKDGIPPMPLHACGSFTQGLLGYMIQQCLYNEIKKIGIKKPVVTVVTQVLVSKDDPAFKNPTKPIGPFYSEAHARKAMEEFGEIWKEDSGRGWRRVVASPEPKSIIEIEAIKTLLSQGAIVIASGGGGIPVVLDDNGQLIGVNAVIDKDLAAERMAEEIDADIFVILTDVPYVAINYKKPNQKNLTNITLTEIKKYFEEGHFKEGSMGPKVKAVMRFVENKKKTAVITSLDNALQAVEGTFGTVVSP